MKQFQRISAGIAQFAGYALTVLVFVSVFSVFTGCQKEESKVLKEAVSTSNLPDLLDKMNADPAFSKEDIDLFTLGLGSYAAKLDSLNGKTVGQIISDERELLRKSSLTGLTATFMNTVHAFGYQGWKPLEQNGQKFFVFGFAIQNKTKDDIKNVEGLLKFVTANNQLIKGFRIKINQGVPASKISQFNSTFVEDQNNRNDLLLEELLTNKNPNVYTLWEPTMIEFANGKKIAKDNPVAAK